MISEETTGIKSGPFWITCTYAYTESGELICDFSEARMIARPLSKYIEKTPSHKESWPVVAGTERNKEWNYYPRGRIEVRKDKVLVFMNPLCLGYEGLEVKLRKRFDIPAEIAVVFKADNSAHYKIAESITMNQ